MRSTLTLLLTIGSLWMLDSDATCSGAPPAGEGPASAPAGRAASFAELHRRAQAGEPLSVVFFGGSLTWGANASDPNRTSWRGLMMDHLRAMYPRAPLTFHDAAIGGTGSKLGIFRLQRDVLAHGPDLVFLEFTVNDGDWGRDVQTLTSYETILRELIGRGVPVVQVFTAFKWDFAPGKDPAARTRYVDHVKLAKAYGTAQADVSPHVQKLLRDGAATADDLWDIDAVHPGDAGYRAFFEPVREAFERAVRDGTVCAVPAEPVFGDAYVVRRRIRLVEGELPKGWTRKRTYRTSAWFDGLSSRWMDDVAVCDAKDRDAVEPLKVRFSGTLVCVFGEMDVDGVGFRAYVDGQLVPYRPDPKKPSQEVWEANSKRFGARLFFFRQIADDLPAGEHTLEIHPAFPEGAEKGQLRIESVCVAGR